MNLNIPRFCQRLCLTLSQTRPLHISGNGKQLDKTAVAVDCDGSHRVSIFRTSENDPTCHTGQHAGQYYTIPPAHVRTLFPHGLPARFQMQLKTFNEACIMVREPSLELLSYLKKADYSKPALRYLLYGEKGCGKTMSLCHALHFCYTQGWLILHIPDAHLWVKNCKELLPSSSRPGRFDQPIQASQWLKNFKFTNEHFLSKIKTTKRYVWTKRESTEEGRTLAELINQGVSRVKSSSDVVGALLRELKLQVGTATDGAFRLAVAVDGVNALWGRTTLKKEDKSEVSADELTLVHNLKKMLRNDWSGGAILTTLSQTGSLYMPRSAYLPSELLGEVGFDKLDPLVPIPVSNYNDQEFESCYLYYMDRNWLQHPHSQTEEGKKELIFLSNKNPSIFERLCAFL